MRYAGLEHAKTRRREIRHGSKGSRIDATFTAKLMTLHKHALQLNSARSLSDICKYTLDAMEFSLGFDFADVTIVENGWLRMIGYRGGEKSVGDLRLDGKGVTVQAANTKATMRIHDTRNEPAYVDGKGVDWKGPPSRLSELAVPVVVDGETAAVLNVESNLFDAISDEDQLLLETLASHVAVAIGKLRGEEKLRESEERTRSLFNRVLDGIYRSTHEGRFVDVNPALVKMFGYSSTQEMLDIPDIKKELYFSPEERGRHLLDTNQEEVKEYRMRRKDGSEIWVEDHGHYIHDEQGNIIFHEGILRDVTERKQTEEELRRSTQFLESVVENANVWLDVIDLEGNVLIWNKAAESISGYSRREVAGGGEIWRWLYPDDEYRKWVTDLVLDPKREIQTNIRRKDGEIRILSWNERHLIGSKGETIGSIVIGRDITEQKRMEDEIKRYSEHLQEMVEQRTRQLSESEARFRELADLLPQIVFEVDQSGNFTFVNRSGIASVGYTEENLRSGLNALQVFMEQDRERVKENMWRILSGENLGVNEYTALRKDGTTFPIMVHSTLIIHEGKPVGLRGIAVDITDRKRLEEELRQSRERLEYIITSNPALIYIGKPLSDFSDYYTIYQSRSTVAITGFESENFIGEKGAAFWASRVHSDDLATYRADTAEFWKRGHRTCEYRFLHKNGTYRWILEESNVVRDSTGKVKDVIGYWVDITERKRMEEELQTAKKRLEYVMQSNPAVICTGKPLPDCSGWRLGYISDRVTEMLGFEPREFVDHPEFWESRVHPDDLLSTKAATSNLKEGQYACDYRFLHKRERYRWIREEARLIRDVNGKPLEVIGCWTDITELKDFEQRLAQAEHLAAIGETAAMVGHDLRNPLQGIAAATYLLRNESLTTDERSELLRLIENNVEYSDGIVKDLLDYSRPLDLTLTEITPREIITSTLQTTRVPDRIKIQNLSQEDPSVSVDPDRMKRAFVNLIENAVDAMPNGGTITISTRESNGFLEIAFADTGLGLPEEILDNLWKPLRTTKAKGMGLGLAIVKRIVDAHGGEVSVKSKTGKGTTYTIRLRLKRNKL